jgi:arylformamidase
MLEHRVTDWDAAYANGPNIPGGERWPDAWVAPAAAYRDELAKLGRLELDIPYGGDARQRFDLFTPSRPPQGLVVYVHGGYWKAFDKSTWSHMARGAVESGFAVAVPSYRLCPAARISEITRDIASAIETAAARIDGRIRLAGHSAGGHLVTRMLCADAPLSGKAQRRIANTVSISGLHDLRPLMRTAMNEVLKLDASEAAAESPALLLPAEHVRLTCWVGGAERSEFLRQSRLLTNIWIGCGASTSIVIEPDRHHFNIIDGLSDPHHALTRALLS